MIKIREAPEVAQGLINSLPRPLSSEAKDALGAIDAALREMDEAQPVAWQSMHAGIPVSETHNSDEADRWRREGVVVRPLYTAPTDVLPALKKVYEHWMRDSDPDELRPFCAEVETLIAKLEGR